MGSEMCIRDRAKVKDRGLLVRTTIYSQHHLSVNVVFIKKGKRFDPV